MSGGPPGSARFDAAEADTALAQFILSLRARGVVDRALLIAFETTPRIAFLPRHNPSLMYAPHPLPIDCGAEATAPLVVAQLLGALGLKPGMSILDIGTGSGFQAAVLARFGCKVVTVERFETLHLAAARAMVRQKIVNVRLEHGDGREGFADGAPYDRIIVNGALRDVPDALVEQLSPGGTLVAPMMLGREQRLYAFDDTGEAFRQRDLGRTSYQMLLEGRARAI
jgi:protein-L-isoaspartate(D-aspartate) O-methyltransferase